MVQLKNHITLEPYTLIMIYVFLLIDLTPKIHCLTKNEQSSDLIFTCNDVTNNGICAANNLILNDS